MRRSFRAGLLLGLLASIGAVVRRVMQARRQEPSLGEAPSWPPLSSSTEPGEPVQVAVTAAEPAGDGNGSGRAPTAPFGPPPSSEHPAGATPPDEPAESATPEAYDESLPDWVEPVEGSCPSTHPVKVKLSSGLFHLPGMAAYNRTNPDRCYRDEESALQDGFTRAKR
ncbi:MAG TPA: hypothetical protein VHE80_12200 [Acidimicrobiales bacterium]|nr:hypothetical protein [Acidimicrobiales bacterium]